MEFKQRQCMETPGEASGDDGGGTGGVSNQLAMLVPTFDPAVDNVDIWASKVSLLLEAWPENKIAEFGYKTHSEHQGNCLPEAQAQSERDFGQ